MRINILEAVDATAAYTQTLTDKIALIAVACALIIFFIIRININKNQKQDSENYNDVKENAENIEIIENQAIFETAAGEELAELEEFEEFEDEEELIAVITAAVSTALKKPVSGFRVVSFKKRSGWNYL